MMTEQLKALMDRIEQLPPDAQKKLAEEIEDILDDAEWHALLADPRSGSCTGRLDCAGKAFTQASLAPCLRCAVVYEAVNHQWALCTATSGS